MSRRTNSPRPQPLKFLDSSNKQELPILSNSSLVAKNKSPTPSQSPSPTKQNGVNSGKTSPSYEKSPRYKNFNCGGEKKNQQNENSNSPSFKSNNNKINRLRTRSGSNSPPPLEPKLEPIKETQLLKPKAEKDNQNKTRTRPEPTRTPTLISKSRLTPTQIMNEYCKHFNIKTHITKLEQCHFCESYIFRPYVETNCCGKIYHSECLSMLYTEKISFEFKNGNTMPYIYFNCECGFSNLDKEGRNYHNLSKIYNYFEVGIKNCIKV